MSIPVRAGRAFTSRDVIGQPLVIVVNETLARAYFAEQPAIGQRLRFGGPETAAEIVGIVGDVRHNGPVQPARGEVYFPQAQEASRSMTLVVKTATDPVALLSPIRAAVEAIDRDQPVYDQRTMRDVVNLGIGAFNFARQLLAAMAVMALFLSTIGIYGVMAHIVGERAREIGIRIALGGTRREVVRTVVAQAMRPAVSGLIVGLIGAGAMANALSAVLIGITALDPITFATAALLLLLAAWLAGYIPARRAARVDPMVTLRSE
jgi:putative ABC transport system permease protein